MSTNIGVNTEMLITAVKDRPCLWNKFHGDYKDRNKSSQAWKEVCYELMEGFDYLPDIERNLFGKEVLKRWNNIRDSFRKYIKQVEKGKTIRKKWFKDEEICLY
ncbi:hypothetical protein Avbf_14143 [Armadillidium vulgare]|nr:hypothetical protein Avbf_14143 [Armadillidium vulgare]